MIISFNAVILLLVLLSVKHFIVDFILQTNQMVIEKGNYGEKWGIIHSLQHGIATCAVFFFFVEPAAVLFFGILDMLIHYHIDWAKININRKNNLTPADKAFWFWLGADQLAHSLTYIWFVWILI
jgi:hypothetical protein